VTFEGKLFTFPDISNIFYQYKHCLFTWERRISGSASKALLSHFWLTQSRSVDFKHERVLNVPKPLKGLQEIKRRGKEKGFEI